MPLTICGFILGIILYIFGRKRQQKTLEIIGVILSVLVVAYWIALLMNQNPSAGQ